MEVVVVKVLEVKVAMLGEMAEADLSLWY